MAERQKQKTIDIEKKAEGREEGKRIQVGANLKSTITFLAFNS